MKSCSCDDGGAFPGILKLFTLRIYERLPTMLSSTQSLPSYNTPKFLAGSETEIETAPAPAHKLACISCDDAVVAEPFQSFRPHLHKRSASSLTDTKSDWPRRRLSYDTQRFRQALNLDKNLNLVEDSKQSGDSDQVDEGGFPEEEIGIEYCNSFASAQVRTAFLRRVLAIVGLQLVIVTAWTLATVNVVPLEQFVREHRWFALGAIVVYCTLYFAVGLLKLGRRFPANLIILFLYTASLAYICGYVTLKFTTWSVLMSLGATATICMFLLLVTWITKVDITGWGIYLTTACCLMMLYGTAVFTCSYILTDTNAMNILNVTGAFFGATLVSVYLLYDLQMMIGGRSREIDSAEWLFAAMALFYDLVMIFVYLLQVLGVLANRPQVRNNPRNPVYVQPA